MEPPHAHHVSEEDLERYSMNRLAERELAEVEEHLLVCGECRGRLEESDRYVRAMRAAAAQARAAERDAGRPLAAWRRPAIWLAVAAALLIVAVIQARREDGPPLAVVLHASRGPAQVYSVAPAGKRLVLELDLADVASFPSYRVEVVDSTGARLWDGPAAIRGGFASVQMPLRLAKGAYYVRLYSPAQELLREYGLDAG
jgi:hypothetical protein